MKVIIASDTHGRDENLEMIMEQEAPVDALIHCGDGEGHEGYIAAMAGCPIYMVRGNNDFFSELVRELEFELAGKKIFLTHGHTYNVSMGPERIMEEGRSRGADIVMYGHTHRPEFIEKKDIIVLNPGSLAYPRQEGRRPSYMVMEADEENNLKFYSKFC